MPAGRKPKPTAVKRMAGNPGKRKLNKAEPKFGALKECPAWLIEEAQDEWLRVCHELKALDLLQSTDRGPLAAYCMAWARWRSAEQTVTAEGQTVQEPITNKDGEVVGYKIKRHPASIIAKDERAAMLRAASLFGFDPSSRSRIHAPVDGDAEDPFEAFMRGDSEEDEETISGPKTDRSGKVHRGRSGGKNPRIQNGAPGLRAPSTRPN